MKFLPGTLLLALAFLPTNHPLLTVSAILFGFCLSAAAIREL